MARHGREVGVDRGDQAALAVADPVLGHDPVEAGLAAVEPLGGRSAVTTSAKAPAWRKRRVTGLIQPSASRSVGEQIDRRDQRVGHRDRPPRDGKSCPARSIRYEIAIGAEALDVLREQSAALVVEHTTCFGRGRLTFSVRAVRVARLEQAVERLSAADRNRSPARACSRCARATAQWNASVDLPTPPFSLAKDDHMAVRPPARGQVAQHDRRDARRATARPRRRRHR